MKTSFLPFVLGAGLVLLSACSREAAEPAGGVAEAGAAAVTENAGAPALMSALPVLGEAPAWTLALLDGGSLQSSDLAGKVVVVDFWATWCPPCRAEIPGYVAMQEALREQGVVIVGISLDRAGPAVVQKFAQDYAINYPIVMGDQDVAEAFGGIEAIPTTFLIDREGRVRHRKVGAMERAEYEPLVRSLL